MGGNLVIVRNEVLVLNAVLCNIVVEIDMIEVN
jgi:hypothetical protein